MMVAGCASASGEPRASQAPLVVELFTSQGCSSCPPADRTLSEIVAEGGVGDRVVVPLAFHVDYWNDLGWPDPFSLPAWTERQYDYARVLGGGRVYTPQMIVGGATDVLGSRVDSIARAVADAPRQIAVTASATWDGDHVDVTATAPGDADVFVAVWEDGLRTKVPRGENSGSTLVGDHVVRRFERVAAAGASGHVAIKLDASWRAVGAVAFAQRPGDRKIIGATLLAR